MGVHSLFICIRLYLARNRSDEFPGIKLHRSCVDLTRLYMKEYSAKIHLEL